MFKKFKKSKPNDCFLTCTWLEQQRKLYQELKNENIAMMNNQIMIERLKNVKQKYQYIIFIGDDIFVSLYLSFIKGKVSLISYFLYSTDIFKSELGRLDAIVEYNQFENINNIHISDFNIYNSNKGHGSILLSYLIDFAKELRAPFITGFLSDVDLSRSCENEKLLYHFYQKFGFEINNKNLLLRLNNSTCSTDETIHSR